MTKYAEDFKKGDIFQLGEYTPTKKEIINFAKKYDPFPFHLDESEAEKTIFKGAREYGNSGGCQKGPIPRLSQFPFAMISAC